MAVTDIRYVPKAPVKDSTKPSRTADTRERRRQRLQAAALELFWAKGYDNVSSSELAAAASVTERTFFRYFDTKDSVVLWYVDDNQLDDLEDNHEGDLAAIVERRARWILRGDADRRLLFARIRLIRATPPLHAQWVAKNHRAANLLADCLIAARPEEDPFRIRVQCVVTFATACVAAEEWAANGGRGNLDDELDKAWGMGYRGQDPVAL